jgi:hypothetical protein
MFEWVFDTPTVVLGILIVAGFAGVGLVGLWLTRRFILSRLGDLSHANEFAGAIHHGILIIYGLVVALIAIAVWENFASAEKLASGEATALAALYRDVDGYPEPARSHIRTGIRVYTEDIIHVAWPLQRSGRMPTRGVELVDRIQTDLFAFIPTTEAQGILHAETLRAYNVVVQARRLRLDAVGSGLPPAMWAVVLCGGLISLFASFCFEVGNPRLQQLMVVLLASMMGLLIFMIVLYDYPFRGIHGVSSESYELIYDHLMKP